MRRLTVLVSIALLAACSKSSEAPNAPANSDAATSSDAAAAMTPLPEAKAVSVEDSTPLYSFSYSYPAAAAAIPALKAWLDGDLKMEKEAIIEAAKEGRADAKQTGFDYMAFDHSTAWDVVADLPGWLSLSAAYDDFTGGAHPNHGFTALLWDKTAGKRLAMTDLFTSKAALDAAISRPFCDALNRQRAEKRGEAIDPQSTDEFDQCIDPSGSTVILGSTDKQHFTRIGVLIAPYAAGPYVEGDYEVTVPVTAAVLKAVKPEYRAAFALGR